MGDEVKTNLQRVISEGLVLMHRRRRRDIVRRFWRGESIADLAKSTRRKTCTIERYIREAVASGEVERMLREERR